MLQRALARLKIPTTLINMIAGLFLNRFNCIFTDFGLTDPYEVLDGIDQGEVISPLLWVIYYDPLFDRITKSDLGFKMSASWHPDLNDLQIKNLNVTIPALAYMDDTIWIEIAMTKCLISLIWQIPFII